MRFWPVRSHVWFVCLVAGFISPVAVVAADPPQAIRGGTLPTDKDGKPLNFDFETGTLKDWTASGTAFQQQPIKGDTVVKRRGDMRSNHAGQYWIGGYEIAFDPPVGTLTSVPFLVTQPFASFLVAGGPTDTTCVEIVRRDSGKLIQRVSGDETENLALVAVDLSAHLGQDIFIRLVDKNPGAWGHLNFDDFRFHEKKPAFPGRVAPLAADVYAHSGLSPLEAAKAMTVPEGFKVTLFAGEPDVQQPIAMAIDDRGRLWVAEAYSYPIRVPEEQARDRILIFEDKDNDGKFDTRKVFLEKLNLVSGLELGYGGVFVGSAPQLLFIPDKDGDDVPDGPPEVLLDGWGYQDTHETLNSFIWGPDGWLYGCHGVFTKSIVGKPGTPDPKRVEITAGIWRYHPRLQAFEAFAHGTSNPWGVDFNSKGQAFATACVIPHLYHVIQGGRYQRQAGPHINPYTYDDIKTIAKHRHYLGGTPHGGNGKSDSAGGGHAHAGAMIYLGGRWPEKYRDQIFMNNIHGARLNMDALAPAGSGYVGDRAPDFLLANDVWSQVLYLTYGPDGNVYMIDWYDRNQCHHGNVPGHDRSNGRIFKVSYEGSDAKSVDLQKGGVDLFSSPSLSVTDLAAAQLSDNEFHARHAQRRMRELTTKVGQPVASTKAILAEAISALEKQAFEHADESMRLRGLWSLDALAELTDERVLRALENDSVYIRAWAIQLTCAPDRAIANPPVWAKLLQMAASDPSPVVRLYLASACQQRSTTSDAAVSDGVVKENGGGLKVMAQSHRAALVGELIKHSEDAADTNLPFLYWYAAESVAAADPQTGLALIGMAKIPVVKGYLVRRMIQTNDPAVLNQLVAKVLPSAKATSDQLLILNEISAGLRGRRQVPMPEGWSEFYKSLSASEDGGVRAVASSLAVTFGDPQALAMRLKTLANPTAAMGDRLAALETLVSSKSANLAPTLLQLLATKELAGPALRGLALYDDPKIPATVIGAYAGFDPSQKRDALNTLASRPAFATAMLTAVEEKKLASADLSADLIRQLRSLKNAEVDKMITKAWGIVRDTPEEKAKLIAALKTLLLAAPQKSNRPDLSLGRAVFVKTCQQCHTLFGAGARTGPELTGSNRANLDYALSNIVDPSAQIGKDYQAQVITTTAGRTLNGLVKAEDQNAITLVTANETVVIPKSEIDERSTSDKSMMPDDILKPLNEREIRSLIAYLASPSQVPLALTGNTPAVLFNGKDLTGWTGNPELWKVEEGEIVGRTDGLKRNEFLINELLLEDFRVEFEIKLVKDEGNSGIQFRSQALPEGEVKGYQADAGPGWWGKLYEENGRGLLWDKSGEAHLKKGEWNRYEISAIGSRIRTWINGQPCVELEDPAGARSGVIALQLHSGGKTEVRYRNFKLTPVPVGAKP